MMFEEVMIQKGGHFNPNKNLKVAGGLGGGGGGGSPPP